MKTKFESFVNSEESKTSYQRGKSKHWFESFVNSEESKTVCLIYSHVICLRALLIQKRVKQLLSL